MADALTFSSFALPVKRPNERRRAAMGHQGRAAAGWKGGCTIGPACAQRSLLPRIRGRFVVLYTHAARAWRSPRAPCHRANGWPRFWSATLHGGSTHAGRCPPPLCQDTPASLARLVGAIYCNCATSDSWQTRSRSARLPSLSSAPMSVAGRPWATKGGRRLGGRVAAQLALPARRGRCCPVTPSNPAPPPGRATRTWWRPGSGSEWWCSGWPGCWRPGPRSGFPLPAPAR